MFSDSDHEVLVPKHKNKDVMGKKQNIQPERTWSCNAQFFFICGFAETFSDLWPLLVSDCWCLVVVVCVCVCVCVCVDWVSSACRTHWSFIGLSSVKVKSTDPTTNWLHRAFLNVNNQLLSLTDWSTKSWISQKATFDVFSDITAG